MKTLLEAEAPNKNSVRDVDQAVHGWYRFVLAFPPHLVQEFFERCGAVRGSTFLDPFCGTGTSLVEAKKLGMRTFGIDANPIACLASRVKTNWSLDIDVLEGDLEKVESRIPTLSKWLARDGIAKALFEDSAMFNDEAIPPAAGGPRLSDEEQSLLPKGYISARPLSKVMQLRQAIDLVPEGPRRDFFVLSLASVIVRDASNVAFGPEIYLGRVKRDAPVFETFSVRSRQMIRELHQAQSEFPDAPPTRIVNGDARNAMGRFLGGRPVDIVLTSPPYPNEKDYTRMTRLELVLLGFLNRREDLRALKGALLRSNTRNVFHDDEDALLMHAFPRIQKIAAAIETRRVEMKKTSGFERLYHRVVLEYFGGMYRHLQQMYVTLRRGAHCGYVVGDQMSYLMVHIPTGQLLEELAEAAGFRVIDRYEWRERWATASRQRLLEEIVWIRKP